MRVDSADMGMKQRKLYLDSSVLGFAVNRRATARRVEANRLLRQIREGHFVGGYSFVLEDEILAAPHRVAARLRHKVGWARLHRISVPSRSRSHDLAQEYGEARIIPWEYFDDALHIAVATLWRADALVSYNFAHIVRLETMVRVNSINRTKELAEVFLCQPSEVILP